MKGILTSYKINDKYLPYIAWATVLCIVAISYARFPLSHAPVGDETYYKQEVDFMVSQGLLQSLAQGTSFFLSCLIFLCSKLFFTSYLIGARLLSIIMFLVNCRLFYLCAKRFEGLSEAGRYMLLLFFAVISSGWLWKGLADTVAMPFFLGAFYLITGSHSTKKILLSAFLVFVGFGVKPTLLMTIPGLTIAILILGYKKQGWKKGFVNSALFGAMFLLCFSLYHIPGYDKYGKLMLENKDHYYEGDKRIEKTSKWYELTVYFEQYNVHHKPNRWQVTWGEIDTFKMNHPEEDLNISYAGYICKFPVSYFGHVAEKVFLTLPTSIQNGFFFAKWITVNRFIHNYFIIQLLTCILIASIFITERKFVIKNLLLLFVPFCYFLILSMYILSQIENNWLLMCLPLLALPVVKFLSERVNFLLFGVLQIVYLFL